MVMLPTKTTLYQVQQHVRESRSDWFNL